ncbi:MAG TPA: ABC transporter ATP-binding protein, partial [Clostridiales bacterium]|nr:ABC transporter ATP-binding protein [Clostridiales bacterium]
MSVIQVNDIHKNFKVYLDKGHTLKDRLLFWNRNKHEERGVLNGISFEVEQGEAIGLVG